MSRARRHSLAIGDLIEHFAYLAVDSVETAECDRYRAFTGALPTE